jgi:hypothetical protein
MFPHVDHGPAHLFKLGVFLPVTFNIARQFLLPPVTVVFRENTVVGTRMPETAVNEHRYPCSSECDVRPSGQATVIDPESQPPLVQLSAQQNFRDARRAWHPLHLGGHFRVK